jgi:DNA-directed RNA polymerase beta subunit
MRARVSFLLFGQEKLMAQSLPRKTYARIAVSLDLPNLIEVQLDSFARLKREGLGDLFHEISPIESYNKGMKLFFPSRSQESQQGSPTGSVTGTPSRSV